MMRRHTRIAAEPSPWPNGDRPPALASGARRRWVSALRLAVASALLPAATGDAGAIVGGRPAESDIGQSLVMVLTEGGAVCSGIVLAPEIILTSGHCVPRGKAVRVYAVLPDTAPGAGKLIVPSASAVHPSYVPNAVGTRQKSVDLALLRLPETLPRGLTPARLASSAAPAAGSPIIVAGDGLAEEGRPNSLGKPRATSLAIVEPYGKGTILLWAAPAQGTNAGACQGDSGGAMLDAGGSVVAVIAFAEGAGKSHCGKLTQGVLVAPQKAFIDTTLAHWGASAQWADR
jgi:S1-C subfamily serine protease